MPAEEFDRKREREEEEEHQEEEEEEEHQEEQEQEAQPRQEKETVVRAILDQTQMPHKRTKICTEALHPNFGEVFIFPVDVPVITPAGQLSAAAQAQVPTMTDFLPGGAIALGPIVAAAVAPGGPIFAAIATAVGAAFAPGGPGHVALAAAIAPLTAAIAPLTAATAPLTAAIAPLTAATAPLTVATAPLTAATAPLTVTIALLTATVGNLEARRINSRAIKHCERGGGATYPFRALQKVTPALGAPLPGPPPVGGPAADGIAAALAAPPLAVGSVPGPIFPADMSELLQLSGAELSELAIVYNDDFGIVAADTLDERRNRFKLWLS